LSPNLRGLKAREVIRALEKAGGLVRQGKGDHVNIKMPNGMIVTVPSARDVPIGLLRDLLKKAQLTTEEFMKYL